jgi:hypothetical protein
MRLAEYKDKDSAKLKYLYAILGQRDTHLQMCTRALLNRTGAWFSDHLQSCTHWGKCMVLGDGGSCFFGASYGAVLRELIRKIASKTSLGAEYGTAKTQLPPALLAIVDSYLPLGTALVLRGDYPKAKSQFLFERLLCLVFDNTLCIRVARPANFYGEDSFLLVLCAPKADEVAVRHVHEVANHVDREHAVFNVLLGDNCVARALSHSKAHKRKTWRLDGLVDRPAENSVVEIVPMRPLPSVHGNVGPGATSTSYAMNIILGWAVDDRSQ